MHPIQRHDRAMTRRGLLRTMAAVGGAGALAGPLAACGGSGGTGSGGGSTVTHWDWYESQAPWVANELSLFSKAYPKINVKRTGDAFASYDNLFTLSERSGDAPDVFFLTPSEPLNQQVQQGWLLPLDSYATSSWIRSFPAYSFVEGVNMLDGKIYSAPFTGTAPSNQLYINNKVFRDAGLTNPDGSVMVPKTWDDVGNAAATIVRKSGGATYGLGFGGASNDLLLWWFDVLVRSAGSPGGSTGLDLRVGKYTYASDRNYADLIGVLMEWKKKGYFYPSSLSISDEISRSFFERGKFGMTVGGVWNEAEWTSNGFTDYSLTTLVGTTDTHQGYYYANPGGKLLGINAHSKNAEAAWEWFSWWHSKDAGVRWVQKYNEDLSVHPEANDPKKINFKPFADYVALAPLCIPGPQPSLRNPAVSNVVVSTVQPDLGSVFAGVYSGQISDVPSALSSLADRSQQALTKGITAAQQQGHKVSAADWVFADWDITKPYKWEIPEYPK